MRVLAIAACAALSCSRSQPSTPEAPPASSGAPAVTRAADASVHEPTRGLAYQLTHAQTLDPSFSPDGARIDYITVVAGKEQLFTADANGSKVVPLTTDDVDHEDPAWSPTGTTIAYVRVDKNAEEIRLVNVDGSGDRALTPPELRVIHPNWSPDGALLAFCTDDDLKPPKKNASDIYTIDVASRALVKRITGGVNTYPSFSPDGERFAFRRMVGETNSEVFVANLD